MTRSRTHLYAIAALAGLAALVAGPGAAVAQPAAPARPAAVTPWPAPEPASGTRSALNWSTRPAPRCG